jgi:hypothetical protein
VSLRLRGHLVARGTVTSDVDTCTSGSTVRIQRRKHGHWRTAGSGVANAQGTFRIQIADRDGRYRALVPESTVGQDTCNQATSPVVHHG